VFSKLDDHDIISALKEWSNSKDFTLQKLSTMILHRDLLEIKLKNKPIIKEQLKKKKEALMKKHLISKEEASYFVFDGSISNQAYHMDSETINLIKKNGKVIDVAKASDQLNIEALSQKVVKYYMCYPKEK